MTHQHIQDNEVIDRYVRQKLTPAERQEFQEHFFQCDECFEQTQLTARFIAGVRDASESGVLAAQQTEFMPRGTQATAINQWWTRSWLVPAVAACLLLALTFIGLWNLSLRRQNKLLAQETGAGSAVSERLQVLEARIRELEGSNRASQEQKESLRQELSRLKEQLAATERQRETHVAQLQLPDVNVPVRNIYPVGDSQRSGTTDEMNQLRMPRGTKTFVLILGDYKAGYATYRLEVGDRGGRVVASRAGLKPDSSGGISVLLNRTGMSRGTYRLKLYGGGKPSAEYLVKIE